MSCLVLYKITFLILQGRKYLKMVITGADQKDERKIMKSAHEMLHTTKEFRHQMKIPLSSLFSLRCHFEVI